MSRQHQRLYPSSPPAAGMISETIWRQLMACPCQLSPDPLALIVPPGPYISHHWLHQQDCMAHTDTTQTPQGIARGCEQCMVRRGALSACWHVKLPQRARQPQPLLREACPAPSCTQLCSTRSSPAPWGRPPVHRAQLTGCLQMGLCLTHRADVFTFMSQPDMLPDSVMLCILRGTL